MSDHTTLHQMVKTILIIAAFFCIALALLLTPPIHSQDSPTLSPAETATLTDAPSLTPTPLPSDPPAVTATETASETPAETPTATTSETATATETETAEASATPGVSETATATLVETPSETGTVEAPTPSLTASPTSTATATASATLPALPSEPPLQLLFSDSFDTGALYLWTLGAGWSLVDSDGGQALQVADSDEPVTFVHNTLGDVAVAARLRFSSGLARLSIRQSEAGSYTALLDASGQVSLFRGSQPLGTTAVPPNAPDQWRALRLSAVGDVVRVSVDGTEVLAVQDAAPLPPGTFSFASVTPSQLTVDDVVVWISASAEPTATPTSLPACGPASPWTSLKPPDCSMARSSGSRSLAAISSITGLGPHNDRLAIQVNPTGQFNMGAFPDATGNAAATSWDLMFHWPNNTSWTSFTTVRVDNVDTKYGDTPGMFVQTPTDIDGITNTTIWQIGQVKVTQMLQIVPNPATGEADLGKMSYTVENLDTASHQVGLRIMIDTELNNNDGAPFRVPNTGIVTQEREFVGSNIPADFQVFRSVTEPNYIASVLLHKASEIPPDRLVLAGWRNIRTTAYDYTVNPAYDFTVDSAYAVYWLASPLAPGASRTYVTYYGLGNVTADVQPPLALAVSGPAALSILDGQYTPNPFEVVATVRNNSENTVAVNNVQLTLNLPAGLTLQGDAAFSVGTLQPGQEVQHSWLVTAASSYSPLTLNYSVTATGTNTQAKVVTRSISIPALMPAPVPTVIPATQMKIEQVYLPPPPSDHLNTALNLLNQAKGHGLNSIQLPNFYGVCDSTHKVACSQYSYLMFYAFFYYYSGSVPTVWDLLSAIYYGELGSLKTEQIAVEVLARNFFNPSTNLEVGGCAYNFTPQDNFTCSYQNVTTWLGQTFFFQSVDRNTLAVNVQRLLGFPTLTDEQFFNSVIEPIKILRETYGPMYSTARIHNTILTGGMFDYDNYVLDGKFKNINHIGINRGVQDESIGWKTGEGPTVASKWGNKKLPLGTTTYTRGANELFAKIFTTPTCTYVFLIVTTNGGFGTELCTAG